MFRTNASDAAWFVVSCGVGVLGWDTVELLLADSGASLSDLLHVVAAMLGLTILHALAAAIVVAPGYAFAVGDRRTSTLLLDLGRWLRRRLADRAPAEAAPTHASILAAPLALAVLVAIAVPSSMRVHESVRVARNAGGAVLLIHLGALVAAALVFAAFRGAFARLFGWLATFRITRGWVARPWITVTLLGSLVWISGVAGVVAGRAVLGSLDLSLLWGTLIALVVGALLAWLRTVPRLSLRARRITAACLLIGMLGTAATAMFVIHYSNNARALMSSHSTFARALDRSQTTLFDWDRDGYSAFFGGNDCAPRDKNVNPGAMDIPYNGIDEDCSGADLRYDGSPITGTWDYPIPDSVPQKFNIVLLTVDALNPDHLGYMGYVRPTSKNLDAFSKRSVIFTDANAQGPSTRLSLPSLFTSRYDPQIHRATEGRIPLEVLPENLTMAEIFRKAGYRTIAILPDAYLKSWRGITQGFQVIDDSPIRTKSKQTSKGVADATILRMQEAVDAKKPFLLWAHFYDPHAPFDQPPDSPNFGSTPMDRYDAEIHHTDQEMGRVLAWIDANLAKDERLVIISADHGESFDSLHRTKHHGFDLHTSVLRVPLLFEAPWLPHRKLDQPVSLIDLLPTLVNLARVPGKFDFEGESLSPALLRGETPVERVTFHTFFIPEDVKRDVDPLRHASARTGRYNLIHNRSDGVYSLYDFRADPEEKRNLYDKQTTLATALRTRLQLWQYRILGGDLTPPAASSSSAPPAASAPAPANSK